MVSVSMPGLISKFIHGLYPGYDRGNITRLFSGRSRVPCGSQTKSVRYSHISFFLKLPKASLDNLVLPLLWFRKISALYILSREYCCDAFFILNYFKHFVGNNGLIAIGVEVPFHEAIVFDFRVANTYGFWRSTRPVYFSLDSSLLRASRSRAGLPVDDGIPCSSNPAAILPKLSPLR